MFSRCFGSLGILCGILFLMAGCGGGGGTTPDTVPVISAVTPSGDVGEVGAAVTFQATASNSPTDFVWDFDGGATPSTSAADSPSVNLSSTAGAFTGSVIATNSVGDSIPFVFRFTVAEALALPVIASVTPSGGAGIAGDRVQFRAQTTGTPTSWTWDFGAGATPAISSDAAPIVVLNAAGSYTGSVVASNALGDSTPLEFTYLVENIAAGQVPLITGVHQPSDMRSALLATFSSSISFVPTSWEWDFGGGASPNESVDESPELFLGDPGAYVGTLFASNAAGASEPFEFAFTVLPGGPVPSVQSISPSGVPIGNPGDPISFFGVLDGHATTFQWDFGGGATPNTSMDAIPQVTLGSSGDYTGSLTVGNANGESVPFPFEYSILPPVPVISAVQKSGSVGLPGMPFTFSATASQNPTSWSWLFSFGATPNSSTDAAPEVTLGAIGSYNASVTATNAGGDSVPFDFAYIVNVPTPPAWQTHTVDAFGDIGRMSALLETEGHLLVVYRDETNQDLRAALSNDSTPDSAADWVFYSIDSLGDVGEGATAAVIGGRPVIAYFAADTVDGFIKVARATTAVPVTASDWQIQTLDTASGDAITDQTLAVAGLELDRLAVFWKGTNGLVKAAISINPAPSVPAHWDAYSLDLGEPFAHSIDAALIGGRLHAAFVTGASGSQKVRVLRALTSAPANSDWVGHTAWATSNIAPQIGLVNLTGRAAVAFCDLTTGTGSLELLMAQNATPTSENDWTRITITTTADPRGDVDLAVLWGRPTISYRDAGTQDLRVARAIAFAPVMPSDWQVMTVDDLPAVGADTSLLVLEDRLAVSYFNLTDQDLKIARSLDEW